jgi:uncharacterized protein YlxW (UPF0749 family)
VPTRSKLAVAVVLGTAAFVVVSGSVSRPSDPGARLPESFRLADLITREQRTSAQLRREADGLRRSVDLERSRAVGPVEDAAVRAAATAAGLDAVHGDGIRVTLDDSSLTTAPSGDVNDLVIHSQDVQAVVNALWRSGASAIAINGQRVVATSAVLCVGNTLLLDGTVHSPPYVVDAVGSDRAVFESDVLVRRLRHDADVVHLGFSIDRVADLVVPGFPGPVTVRYASPLP